LTTGLVEYGTTPTYPGGSNPTRPSDAQYDYQFSGWDPALGVVTTNTTYTAVYTPILRVYTATIVSNNSSY
jgi:hypothetical protein